MVDDAGSGPVGPEGQVAIILYIHYGLNQGIPMQYFPSSTDPDDMDGADEVLLWWFVNGGATLDGNAVGWCFHR